jgi:hypothetical protein
MRRGSRCVIYTVFFSFCCFLTSYSRVRSGVQFVLGSDMVHRNLHAIRLRDYVHQDLVHQDLGHHRQPASSISHRSRASATTLAARAVQDREMGMLSHWRLLKRYSVCLERGQIYTSADR